jgi:ligand-binding sensor domain-containing protein
MSISDKGNDSLSEKESQYQLLSQEENPDSRADTAVPWYLFPGEYIAISSMQQEPVFSLFITPFDAIWAVVGSQLFVHEQGHWQREEMPADCTIAHFGGFEWYRERLWARGLGLLMHDHQKWQSIRPDIFTMVTSTIVDRLDNLWVGTSTNGLWRTQDGQNWEQVVLPTKHMSIGALWCDDEGAIWIAETGRRPASRPIHYLRNDVWTTLPLPSRPGFFRDIGTLITDTIGRLWAGSTSGGGVWLWANNNWKHFAAVSHPDRKFGLPGSWIRGLYVDRLQRVWSITQGGIGCYDNGNWHLTVIPAPPGVLFEMYGLIPESHFFDNRGKLWFGTRQGRIGRIDTTQPQYIHPLKYVMDHNNRLLSNLRD